jgi:hypothetical protein
MQVAIPPAWFDPAVNSGFVTLLAMIPGFPCRLPLGRILNLRLGGERVGEAKYPECPEVHGPSSLEY